MTGRRATLSAGNGGWVRAAIDDDPPFEVRVRPNDRGRLEVVELRLSPGGPIDSTTLRQVPLARVEGLVNAPDLRDYIIARLDEPGGEGFDRTDQVVEGGELKAHAGVAEGSGTAFPAQVVRGGGASAAQRVAGTTAGRRGRFFTVPPAGRRIEVELTDTVTATDSLTVTRSGRPRAKLRVPTTNPKPPKFYQEVARAYLELAVEGNRPAVELADANGVPLSTAHRWVKRARELGFLPPGQKGRRG